MEQKRTEEHNQSLADTKPQEGRLVTMTVNHVTDRNNGQGRAGAECRRRQPGGQSATVGEPLERVAHAGAIHNAHASAADRGAQV
jgi:hypothetical protein